jgi:hypothetical protein
LLPLKLRQKALHVPSLFSVSGAEAEGATPSIVITQTAVKGAAAFSIGTAMEGAAAVSIGAAVEGAAAVSIGTAMEGAAAVSTAVEGENLMFDKASDQ